MAANREGFPVRGIVDLVCRQLAIALTQLHVAFELGITLHADDRVVAGDTNGVVATAGARQRFGGHVGFGGAGGRRTTQNRQQREHGAIARVRGRCVRNRHRPADQGRDRDARRQRTAARTRVHQGRDYNVAMPPRSLIS